MSGIVKRGGSGQMQSKDAKGRYGVRATQVEGEVEIKSEKDSRKLDRSKLPTQANRVTRGPEVVG